MEDASNIFFATLAKHIEDRAKLLDYRIIYCSTQNNDEKGNELIKMLLRWRVDGFLITPSKGMHVQVSKLCRTHKPVVLLDRFFPDINIPHVLVHNYLGVKAGIEHLIKKGYSHIAFVTVDLDQVQMHQREQGYSETLKIHKLNYDEKLTLKLHYEQSKRESIEQIASFIKSNPEIDAIFFATNYLGVFGLESIKLLKLSIPDDIAVVCFDDNEIFKIFKPEITTIEQPIEEIATTSVDMLISTIEGLYLPDADFHINKDTRLILRGST